MADKARQQQHQQQEVGDEPQLVGATTPMGSRAADVKGAVMDAARSAASAAGHAAHEAGVRLGTAGRQAAEGALHVAEAALAAASEGGRMLPEIALPPLPSDGGVGVDPDLAEEEDIPAASAGGASSHTAATGHS